MATITVRRGTKTELNSISLNLAELGFCTDTKEVYIGDGVGNTFVGACLIDIFAFLFFLYLYFLD